MSDTRLLVVHARSPLHAGTGQSTAAVDLPIARDRATSHPLLPGSSLKGALRNVCRGVASGREFTLFGPETDRADEHAGALAFSDARLVLMPVRSLAGTFAWVTCPWVLTTLRRDGKLCSVAVDPPSTISREEAWLSRGTSLSFKLKGESTVVLEEHDLKATRRDEVDKWAKQLGELLDPAWSPMLEARLCVVADDVFTFLAKHGTDVVTRVRIDPDTGTAKDGQLWTEENLPSESVLVGPVQAMAAHDGADPQALFGDLERLLDRPVQLGGKATVGRGRCDLRLVGV